MIKSDFLELERLFLALGDKTRLRLLALIAGGEVPVNFLAEGLGESQPKVSRHLAYLRKAGVVSTRRDGKWIYYCIADSQAESLRQILGTVVQSLVSVRVDREDAIPVAQAYPGKATDIENNIYADADMYVEDDMPESSLPVAEARREPDTALITNIYANTDMYIGESVADDNIYNIDIYEIEDSEEQYQPTVEMDVFLL